MSNLAYAARLLEYERPNPLSSERKFILFTYLFISLILLLIANLQQNKRSNTETFWKNK